MAEAPEPSHPEATDIRILYQNGERVCHRRDGIHGAAPLRGTARRGHSGARTGASGVRTAAGGRRGSDRRRSAGRLDVPRFRRGLRHVRAPGGRAHPSPAKAAQFRSIDLVSAKQAIPAGAGGGRPPFRVRERGASGAGDARVHRGAHGSGRGDPRGGAERHHPAAVVCAGSRTAMAAAAAAGLLADGGASGHARIGAAAGAGDAAANDRDAWCGAVEHPPSGVRVVEVPEIRLTRL